MRTNQSAITEWKVIKKNRQTRVRQALKVADWTLKRNCKL